MGTVFASGFRNWKTSPHKRVANAAQYEEKNHQQLQHRVVSIRRLTISPSQRQISRQRQHLWQRSQRPSQQNQCRAKKCPCGRISQLTRVDENSEVSKSFSMILTFQPKTQTAWPRN